MTDSAPPPPPPENPYGQTPYGQSPPTAPGYGQSPYGPPGAYGAPAVPRPGELGDRFLAKLIDWAILIAVLIVVGLIVAVAFSGGTFSVGTSSSYAANAVSGVVGAAIVLGYFTLLESNRGQTVGKMAMKLRVVAPDGQSHPSPAEAFKRNIYNGFQVLALIPIVGGFIGLIVILVADIMIAVGISNEPARRQPWTDRFAGGTQVLKVG